jgi:hypothetical protein
VDLRPHPDALHEPPGRLVVGEAVRGHPAQAEVLEADPDQLPDRLGGVAVAAAGGVEHPAELGLHLCALLEDLRLRPAVLHGDHQVADDLAAQLDDERLGQHVRGLELAAVVLDGPGRPDQPAAHPSSRR